MYKCNNNLRFFLSSINKSDLCRQCSISRQHLYNLIDCKCYPSMPVAKAITLYICENSLEYHRPSYLDFFNRLWIDVPDPWYDGADGGGIL